MTGAWSLQYKPRYFIVYISQRHHSTDCSLPSASTEDDTFCLYREFCRLANGHIAIKDISQSNSSVTLYLEVRLRSLAFHDLLLEQVYCVKLGNESSLAYRIRLDLHMLLLLYKMSRATTAVVGRSFQKAFGGEKGFLRVMGKVALWF